MAPIATGGSTAGRGGHGETLESAVNARATLVGRAAPLGIPLWRPPPFPGPVLTGVHQRPAAQGLLRGRLLQLLVGRGVHVAPPPHEPQQEGPDDQENKVEDEACGVEEAGGLHIPCDN